MGYNKDDYIKVRNEFETKYLKARRVAEERTFEIHAFIPDIADIDRVLSGTGMDIMAVITSQEPNWLEKISELENRNNALIQRREELLAAYGFSKDYTDVHYDCEVCGDTGYTENGGMCDCMKRAIAKEGYMSSCR